MLYKDKPRKLGTKCIYPQICAEGWICIVSFAEVTFLTKYSEYGNCTINCWVSWV